MRALALFAALSFLAASSLLAGCVEPVEDGGATTEDEGTQPDVPMQPDPVAVSEDFDLAQGMSKEYRWEAHAGFKTAMVRVTWGGPEGVHGPGHVCAAFAKTEETENGVSKSSQGGGCGGISVRLGGNNLEEETLVAHDARADLVHGSYTLTLSSEPQVGTLHVEISVTY